jgi:hypothetical protein
VIAVDRDQLFIPAGARAIRVQNVPLTPEPIILEPFAWTVDKPGARLARWEDIPNPSGTAWLAVMVSNEPTLGLPVETTPAGVVVVGRSIAPGADQEWSPASQAGIRPGDVVVNVAGSAVRQPGDIDAAVLSQPAPLRVDVSRGGNSLTFEVPVQRSRLRCFKTSGPQAVAGIVSEVPPAGVEIACPPGALDVVATRAGTP